MDANLAQIIVFSQANAMSSNDDQKLERRSNDKDKEQDNSSGDNASMKVQLGRDTPKSIDGKSRSEVGHSSLENDPEECCPSTPPSKSSSADSEHPSVHCCSTCDDAQSYVGKGKGRACDRVSRQSSSQGNSSVAEHGQTGDGNDEEPGPNKCCALAPDPTRREHCCSSSEDTFLAAERKQSIFSCREEPHEEDREEDEEDAQIEGFEEDHQEDDVVMDEEYASEEQPDVPSEYSVETETREALQASIAQDSMLADLDSPTRYTQSSIADTNVCTPVKKPSSPRKSTVQEAKEESTPVKSATSKEEPPVSEEVPETPVRTESPELTKRERKKRRREKRSYEKAAKKVAKLQAKVDRAARKAGETGDGAADDPTHSPPIGAGEQSFLTYHTADEFRSASRQLDGNYSEGIDTAAHVSHDSLPHDRIHLTEQDNKRIRRKTDRVILVILVWVYFLQILDKTVLGYGTLFGLQQDTGLVGNQYSLVGSIAPIAQLAWQPFSSILIVKVPHRILMPILVLGWGIAQTSMAACHNYSGLLITRFFLGLFEAGCLPLFSVITNQWYRRSEQPMRVAAWYSTNGLGTIAASALSFGLGHIPSDTLKSWQIIFLFVGVLTILSAPFVYWRLDNDVTSARFLSEYEKAQAVERLRANQTGIGSRKFEMSHLYEILLEPKTFLWISMSLLLNVGASVTNTFGPLILSGFGYDKYVTSLLNIPFGFAQLLAILLASYAAHKAKVKSGILIALVIPVISGLALLYAIPRANSALLLFGYYLLPFLFGSNPLIVSWIIGNTAGTTKKSIIMSLYNAGSSAGNIIGPLLFDSKDAPEYHPGLRAVLAIFILLAIIIVFQLLVLISLNRKQERTRISNGKPKVLKDVSMEDKYAEFQGGEHASDLTDGKNDEFVYIY